MLAYVMSLILVIVSLFNLWWGFGTGLHADMLHLPLMYADASAGQLHWFFYNLPPSRFIFPDIPLYFILHTLIGNGIAALIANVWFNYLLLAALLILNAHLWFRIPVRTSLFPVIFSLSLLTLPNIFSWGIVVGLFWPTGHAGAVQVTLCVLALLALYKNTPTPRHTFYLIISGLFIGFTDALCFVLTLIPTCAILLSLKTPPLRRRILVILGLIATTLIGSWLGDRLMPVAKLQYLHQMLPPASWLFERLSAFIRDLANPHVIPAFLIVVIGTALAYSFWRRKKLPTFIYVGFLGIVFLPIAAMLANGRYMDIESARYFALSLLFPFLALIAWAWQFPRIQKILPLASALLLLSPIFAWSTFPRWSTLNYPPLVQKLDELKTTYHLQSGLSGYWQAKPITYFSRNGLTVNALAEDGSTFLKLGSLAWLGLPYTPPPALHYNFILLKNTQSIGPNNAITPDVDINALLERFGPPAHIKRFTVVGQLYLLMIYNYNLATILEFDPGLWSLIGDRLQSCSYFLSDTEYEHTSQNLLRIMKKYEHLQK